MFNLLPENLKEQIKKDYHLRLSIIVLSFVILSQISFLIFLFPSWLISYYKEKDYLVKNDEISKNISAIPVASTTAVIKSLNEKLLNIDRTLEYPEVIPLIDSVISTKTSAIRIGDISYTVSGVNSGVLNINGMGEKRESIVNYSENLKKIDLFKKVDLPISNLAKDKNIDFSISINIEK
ncbi:MAG TPA: hypothetical protein PLZ99_02895 [Parcubacteria group bacterium]|nr:hypothetical protein [Parcubacteria group bacterium]